jgi:hypothetical protein
MTGVNFIRHLPQTKINLSRIEILRRSKRKFSMSFTEISLIILMSLIMEEFVLISENIDHVRVK